MGAVEMIGMAGSLSLLAGWRLYASLLAAGIAMRLGIIDLPDRLDALDVLANPWVIGAAGFGTLAELLADKVAWLDSLWDTVHTLVRPAGGALLALAVVDAGDPVWQVVTILLGGGAALLSHSAKAGARAVVNTSPEPMSNMVVSTGEDIATAGSLWLVMAHPTAAVIVALVVLATALLLLVTSWRALRGIRRRLRGEPR